MKNALFLIVASVLMGASRSSLADPLTASSEWNGLLGQVIQAESTELVPSRPFSVGLSASVQRASSDSGSRNLGLRLRYLVERDSDASLELLAGITNESSSVRGVQSYRFGFTSEAELVSWKNFVRILTTADVGGEYSSGWSGTEGEYQDVSGMSYFGGLGIALRLTRTRRFDPFVRLTHEWYFSKANEKRALGAELGIRF